ncbi:MAG: LAGLIDADG family homing endonuclease [Candidatus Nanohaloarchaea archaeon]|nr:LAGLIDADG family homing endonuclease [Candidatus Nanohaloarchaea archaeon]
MRSLSDFERGWISGLIDGEGSLRLRPRDDGKTYKPSIVIANNSPDLIARLQNLIPEGKVYRESREEEDWEGSFQFVIWQHSVMRELLDQISDDLIVKQ